MATYLLLRNNKESGPYSLNDLANFGLKPYDLVWVEGRSAAWRYPSEIEELKPYAPAVEEQPFDRFFKKNSEEKQPIPVQQTNNIEKKYEKYLPKKSVAVTLPSQKKMEAQQPVATEERPIAEAPTITIKENPAAAQVKYSQPLDEIKEMYVKTLQQRKTKIARKSVLMKSLKSAVIVAVLISVGLLAGFMIKSGAAKKNNIVQQAVSATPATQQETGTAAKDTATAQENKVADDIALQQSTDSRPDPAISESYEMSNPKDQPAKDQQAGNKAAEKKEAVIKNLTPSPVENDPVTGERNRVVRDNEAKSMAMVASPGEKSAILPVKKTGLESLVSVSSNDYKKVAFGGIRNLELTVTNDSKYSLEKVTVQLQYLKPSEEPLKTENVLFLSVSPNSSLTLRIPDTNRGIKVKYKITDIQLQQSTAAVGF